MYAVGVGGGGRLGKLGGNAVCPQDKCPEFSQPGSVCDWGPGLVFVSFGFLPCHMGTAAAACGCRKGCMQRWSTDGA